MTTPCRYIGIEANERHILVTYSPTQTVKVMTTLLSKLYCHWDSYVRGKLNENGNSCLPQVSCCSVGKRKFKLTLMPLCHCKMIETQTCTE